VNDARAVAVTSSLLPLLSEADVRAALDWKALIRAMERALAEFSAGRVIQPPRQWIGIEKCGGYFGLMPAVAEEAMGIKLVTLYPRNAGTAVPSVMAIVVLFRTQTGEPLALMDGRLLTEMRTAAVSAAVTDRVASRSGRVLALLGSGVQARAHFSALQEVRRFDDVRVWSPTPANAARFADEIGGRAVDAESAVRGADVVVTATHAREPILKGAWLKPGAHVNAVGAPMPTWRELDDDAMANLLIVDSREAVLHESGDVILSKAPIFAEAGELFAGTRSCPESATTVFKSVGLAIEDVAAAALAFERWTQRQRA
jgi:ornithine cyclodeaminase/alanine dehydrogenase-like protein (mu-crystallin family)